MTTDRGESGQQTRRSVETQLGPPTQPTRWSGFWFSTGSPTELGVFRALFAVCLVFEVETGLTMNVFAFSLAMLASYVLFLRRPDEANRPFRPDPT